MTAIPRFVVAQHILQPNTQYNRITAPCRPCTYLGGQALQLLPALGRGEHTQHPAVAQRLRVHALGAAYMKQRCSIKASAQFIG
jgi:hypothetical protein